MADSQVRPTDGTGSQLGGLVGAPESVEQVVIRHLGMALAQNQVDLAFALSRNALAKEFVKRLMDAAQDDPDRSLLISSPMLGTLYGLLA